MITAAVVHGAAPLEVHIGVGVGRALEVKRGVAEKVALVNWVLPITLWNRGGEADGDPLPVLVRTPVRQDHIVGNQDAVGTYSLRFLPWFVEG